MGVRSQQLAFYISTSGAFSVIYTVPSGHTTIVKEVRAGNGGALPQSLIVTAYNGTLQPAVVVTGQMAAGSVRNEWLWLVLEAGDQLVAYPSAAAVSCVVSGAELQGNA